MHILAPGGSLALSILTWLTVTWILESLEAFKPETQRLLHTQICDLADRIYVLRTYCTDGGENPIHLQIVVSQPSANQPGVTMY